MIFNIFLLDAAVWNDKIHKLLISSTLQFREETKSVNVGQVNNYLLAVLKQHGYKYTLKQVASKMDSLKRKYKYFLEQNQNKTGNERKEWHLFDVSI